MLPDELQEYSEILTILIQLPIVGLFVFVVFKFMAMMKEERVAFTKALDGERASREVGADKLNDTLVGLGGGVRDLHNAVTELRTDVRERPRG